MLLKALLRRNVGLEATRQDLDVELLKVASMRDDLRIDAAAFVALRLGFQTVKRPIFDRKPMHFALKVHCKTFKSIPWLPK